MPVAGPGVALETHHTNLVLWHELQKLFECPLSTICPKVLTVDIDECRHIATTGSFPSGSGVAQLYKMSIGNAGLL